MSSPKSSANGLADVDVRYDNRQAAHYLKLKPQTLSKWRVSGAGPPYLKVGRLVQYRKTDLDNFLNNARRLSTSGP